MQESPGSSYWLTVISVHRDDHQNLRKTLKSVSRQKTQDVEYLVVDGSKDLVTTIEICKEYLGGNAKVIPQTPQGIYSAMNIGLAHAQGHYVYFLNAGDIFHSEQVLHELKLIVSSQDPLWVYGGVQFIDRIGRQRLAPTFDYDKERKHNFRAGRFPMQPATLVQTEVLRSLGGFDLALQIAADYKVVLSLSKVASPLFWNGTVVDFALGGDSSVKWINALQEAHRARVEVFSLSGLARIADFVLSTPVYIRGLASRMMGRV